MDAIVATHWPDMARSLPAAGVRRLVGFTTLLLLTGTVLCRPGESVPGLLGLPLYSVMLVAGFCTNLPESYARLTARSLLRQPIALCVAGMLPAVILSHAAHGSMWAASTAGVEFLKVLGLYLLLVAVLDSPGRIRVYLWFVAACVTILTCLALLHHHGVVQIPGLQTYERWRLDPVTGRIFLLRRLVSAGIFANPNDLCLLLFAILPLAMLQIGDRLLRWRRYLWLASVGLLAYGAALTQSRGGFIALLAGTAAFVLARFGWRRGTLLAAAIVPLLFLLFGGRQTDLDLSRSTGQSRVQLWVHGCSYLAESPLFGIGYGEFVNRAGLVAHNSFIHCYAELGLLGGTIFLSAFFFAASALWRLRSRRAEIEDGELRRALPYLIATVSVYAVGLLSLSRAYVEPTYLILGLVTAYSDTAFTGAPPLNVRTGRELVLQGVGVSACFLAGAYTFIQVFASS